MNSTDSYCFALDLVWQAIAESLSSVRDVWWEYPDIVDSLDAFRRVSSLALLYWARQWRLTILYKSLFVPLVEKLGYKYPKGEALDKLLLRTLAVEHAYEAGDPRSAFF